MPSIAMLRRDNPLFERSNESSPLSTRFDSASGTKIRRFVSHLVRRNDGNSDMVINALIAVLAFAFFALIVVAIFFLRRRRLRRVQCQESTLPSYNEVKHGHPNHRGLTIETTHNGRSSVLFICRDGQPMLRSPGSPPHSPDNVPEIHITFPDEHDDQGRRKSGRVVVVRVGENATVGLEPMQEEQLPAYEKEAKGQFYSIDMDQIGGLKEKDRSVFEK